MHNPWRDGHTGFCEVVVSVSHPGKAAGLARGGELAVLHQGRAAPELHRAWGLKPHATVEETVLHAPAMAYGYLRFTQVSGLPQQPVRPLDARPWDTGGLWLIYTRSTDDEARSRALASAGWPTLRGVHAFDFGELAVKEVHHHGPDGLVLSVIEQIKPPLALPVTGLTHAFNAAILVRDFARARHFFVDVLGFKPWMEVVWDADNPGLTLLSDLADFRGFRSVRTLIVHPEGTNEGSVELIAFEGGELGRDFADRGRPPNLGALALRFAVPDLAAHLARLAAHGVAPARPVTELTLAPYGLVRLAPVVSPDGVWLEFFEVRDGGP